MTQAHHYNCLTGYPTCLPSLTLKKVDQWISQKKTKKNKEVSVFTALICIRIFNNLLFGLLREISLSLYVYISLISHPIHVEILGEKSQKVCGIIVNESLYGTGIAYIITSAASIRYSSWKKVFFFFKLNLNLNWKRRNSFNFVYNAKIMHSINFL